jgi:hypothetical protein
VRSFALYTPCAQIYRASIERPSTDSSSRVVSCFSALSFLSRSSCRKKNIGSSRRTFPSRLVCLYQTLIPSPETIPFPCLVVKFSKSKTREQSDRRPASLSFRDSVHVYLSMAYPSSHSCDINLSSSVQEWNQPKQDVREEARHRSIFCPLRFQKTPCPRLARILHLPSDLFFSPVSVSSIHPSNMFFIVRFLLLHPIN